MKYPPALEHKKKNIIELTRTSLEEYRAAGKLPLIVALDNVRSLNNVGSLLRTCDALRALLRKLDDEDRDSFTASSAIMIAPGFSWRIVSAMVTNFHQPQSTLLLLVSSFLSRTGAPLNEWRRVYDEALARDYRFLSYGDSCLFI